MSGKTLIAHLRGRGVCLQADGDRLRYRAPRGVLDPQTLRRLAEHKAEILACLEVERIALDVHLVAMGLGMDLDPDGTAAMLWDCCPGLAELDTLPRLRAGRAAVLVGLGREPFPDGPASLKEAADQVAEVWRSGDHEGARRLFAAAVLPGLPVVHGKGGER
jgi:hypothetical protein